MVDAPDPILGSLSGLPLQSEAAHDLRGADPELTFRNFEATPHTLPEQAGVREAWHRGRRRFSVWLLRVRHEAVAERAAEVARLLSPFIVAQAEADLHVTSFVAGFACPVPVRDDDVAEAELDAQERVLTRLAAPLTFAVGGASSFASAPFLEVTFEDDRHERLRAELARQQRELRLGPFVPHVTVGRYVGAFSTREIAERLRPKRRLAAQHVRPSAIELVEVDPMDSRAPLLTVRQVSLS